MTERQEELIKKFQSVFGENWKYQINDITSDEKSEEVRCIDPSRINWLNPKNEKE